MLKPKRLSGSSDGRKPDRIRTGVFDEKTGERITGVWTSGSGRYASKIFDPFNKKHAWLGTFDTIQQASDAYQAKKKEFQARRDESRGFEWVKAEETMSSDLQEASDANKVVHNEEENALDSKPGCNVGTKEPDQSQTQSSGPEFSIKSDETSPRDLRKEIVTVESSEYNGGGAMGFMIPDPGGQGKVFLPVIDNCGFLIGRIGEGDLTVLDNWLSTR